MTAFSGAVRRAALFLFTLILLSGCAKGEDVSMSTVPVTLQKSYKKAGENNPLYTQRFGADPGVMEYDGRLYVYMTDDIIEYDSTGKVKENSCPAVRRRPLAPVRAGAASLRRYGGPRGSAVL